ncbi:MAG: DNA topoisomerase III [Planctomycetaceae bacterium]|nr:DNA topoisomerase III [Planctomycetaceae bacterium]
MKVVLAEKPSVAREIAAFLGANSRRDGYLEGSGYQVTWAFGHLVTLKEPDEYDASLKKWTLEDLPFIPEHFELKLIKDKRSKAQFSIVKGLLKSASEIICATDAGREGELIYRYIVKLSGCERKPASRLWLSSLTRQAISDAFKKLKPIGDFTNLYDAARCRSESDWIVGLNSTRNFTVRFGKPGLLWSVGRVQTPVLSMIVERDDEISVFRSEKFWELITTYREATFRHTGDRFLAQDDGEKILEQVRGHALVIQSVRKKRERSLPPLLHDLTELQREMNRRFGMPAAKTLQVAQSLYEKKLLTYPRTDSRYLTRDMKSDVRDALSKLAKIKATEISKLDLGKLNFSARIINDKKVSDHHAIIPTGQVPSSLPPDEQKVWDAVVTRFIAAFYPPCLKDVTTVDAISNQIPFRARGTEIVDPGWTVLEKRKPKDKKDDETQQEMPSFRVGERGPHDPTLKEGETKPPKHFTENSLLAMMETAGKLVDDDELREAMKERGLGTPATRAAIIEILLKRQYITRSKKTLLATDLGRYLIAIIRDDRLKSPELTGRWEAKLRQIEAGQVEAAEFMDEIAAYTTEIINSSDQPEADETAWGKCPKCNNAIIQGKRGFGCSKWKDGCGFVLWREYQNHVFSDEEIRCLLQFGNLTKPGQENVMLKMTSSGAVVQIPVPSEGQRNNGKSKWGGKKRGSKRSFGKKSNSKSKSIGNCPLCQADVAEQKISFSCTKWKEGCKFVIWKTIAGKRISARTAKTLISKGATSTLKGFQSKAGKPFAAKLKLVEGKVEMEFD